MRNRKARHNAAVREKILEGAGRLFRKVGYDAAGIDALMASAGLTRGAFYAHFKSKNDLFIEVLREDHPLLRKLQTRDGSGTDDLWQGMRQIFREYLNPANLDEVSVGCSLAALGSDVTQSGEAARRAYEDAHRSILQEMRRGQPITADDPHLVAALTVVVGAVTTAAAGVSEAHRRAILDAALQSFLNLTSAARVRGKDATKRGKE
jgi:TetR/AcrR family transcriptional repressor of nem operon